jgi:acetyl esterase/lipase
MTALYASLDLPYAAHPAQRYDLFMPDSRQNRPVIVCFHGGWWNHGRHQDLRAFCLHLAELGQNCATVGIRQFGAGAQHGQDIIDDAKAGIAKVAEEVAMADTHATSLFLLGTGSGSLIAMVAAAQLAQSSNLRLCGVIACGVSPSLETWDGCNPALGRTLDQFAAGHRLELNPLSLTPSALPPLLLLHGDEDTEVPAKLVQRLHARMVEAGESSTLAFLSGLGHQFIEQPFERGGKAAIERILPFIDEHAWVQERERLFTGRGKE